MSGFQRANAAAAHVECVVAGHIHAARVRLWPAGDRDAFEVDGLERTGRSRQASATVVVFGQHTRVFLCRVPQTATAIPRSCREMAI
jgi:hypothetical protein